MCIDSLHTSFCHLKVGAGEICRLVEVLYLCVCTVKAKSLACMLSKLSNGPIISTVFLSFNFKCVVKLKCTYVLAQMFVCMAKETLNYESIISCTT